MIHFQQDVYEYQPPVLLVTPLDEVLKLRWQQTRWKREAGITGEGERQRSEKKRERGKEEKSKRGREAKRKGGQA